MKTILISENISLPFDEGLKNIIYYLIKALKEKERNNKLISNLLTNNLKEDLHIITKNGNNINGLDIEKVKLNKLFLNNKLRLLLKNYSPEIILYIPEASYTFNSFVRAKVLQLMNQKGKVVILGVQHREYNFLFEKLMKFVHPNLIFLLSMSDKIFFEKKGIKVKVIPPAIDAQKFCRIRSETKMALRKNYGLPCDKKIVLHVGHIKQRRNLECFLYIQKICNIQTVIVGSTTTLIDKRLKSLFEKHGIIIIDNYLPKVQEIYQLSDIYVFPVVRQDAAIEMPLSILEALACNIPVITTRFGGLVDYFKEDIGFRYFESTKELLKLVKIMGRNEIHNDKKVEHFTWDKLADEILVACEELI